MFDFFAFLTIVLVLLKIFIFFKHRIQQKNSILFSFILSIFCGLFAFISFIFCIVERVLPMLQLQ
jgi:hypothetical protein